MGIGSILGKAFNHGADAIGTVGLMGVKGAYKGTKTILKGAGKASVAMDKAAGKMGADYLGKVAADTVTGKNGAVKKVAGSIFRKVEGVAPGGISKDSLIQQVAGFKMNKKAGLGMAGGALAVGIGVNMGSTSNSSNIGEIEAGQLSNTIGSNASPGIEATVDEMDKNPEFKKDFEDHLGINSYGASGDIVMALHNLR